MQEDELADPSTIILMMEQLHLTPHFHHYHLLLK